MNRLSLFATLMMLHFCSSAIDRRLLQFPSQNVPTQPSLSQPPIATPYQPPVQVYQPYVPAAQQVPGYYGQLCDAPQSDFMCRVAGQILNDMASGKIECNNDYSCCMCGQISCGYSTNQPCNSVSGNGEYALYGVQSILVRGEANKAGATLDCGAPNACNSVSVTGEWMNTVICGSTSSCTSARMELLYSLGIFCGVSSCIDGTFILRGNRGGILDCGGYEACVGATFMVDGGIEVVSCGSERACKNAKISIISPKEGFHLSCGGNNACENLEIELIVPAPTVGDCRAFSASSYIKWTGVSCSSNDACKGLKFTLKNDGCVPILIENLNCESGGSCSHSVFDFFAGTLGQWSNSLLIQNCKCGSSCLDASGIDPCFNNLRVVECLQPQICASQRQLLSNIANGFLLNCGALQACTNLDFSINIAGASNNLIRTVTGFHCVSSYACQYMVVRINNMQYDSLGQMIATTVESVLCIGDYACDGVQIITGANVYISHVQCQGTNACRSCFVKQTVYDVGVPCDQATAAVAGASTTSTLPPPVWLTAPPVVTLPPIVITPQTTAYIPPIVIPTILAPPPVVVQPTTTTTTTAMVSEPPPPQVTQATPSVTQATIPDIPKMPGIILVSPATTRPPTTTTSTTTASVASSTETPQTGAGGPVGNQIVPPFAVPPRAEKLPQVTPPPQSAATTGGMPPPFL
eukprot:CAMPEP_0202685590 /NCGR_PEP_ID=MMETSP1385-20130828/1391_1 /ASSEMBLY_ACC=CAM_ASM_000861 /TAXON_ID=933848 /ORGANISM="Elphidium margaritaceum" /LENGTH=693 /DNA_ID=CAMNT_0049339985 /DNA_START=29 /DNA_END=2110 /DNA_ORIENTATION=+